MQTVIVTTMLGGVAQIDIATTGLLSIRKVPDNGYDCTWYEFVSRDQGIIAHPARRGIECSKGLVGTVGQ